MKLRKLLIDDLEACVNLLIEAYNPSPWNYHWTQETGKKYLSEFICNDNFIGYVLLESEEIIGAMLAHRKTWWTNDEIFVDELFIKPDRQRHGCGEMLMKEAEQLAKEMGLGGVTLLTDRYHPAKLFYEKNGYTLAEHVIFMYKEVV
jgi:aminoglycoside 6'-N-acetyltransferase I